MHGRFGFQTAVKLVHGDSDPRLERSGLTRVPTFGNLRDHPVEWLIALFRRCVTAGWISFSGSERPVVDVGDLSKGKAAFLVKAASFWLTGLDFVESSSPLPVEQVVELRDALKAAHYEVISDTAIRKAYPQLS